MYTMKHKSNGTIEHFKARLVAKGYTQTYGIDYTDTFAPMAKINTLSEEVYMDLPPGYMIPEVHCRKKTSMSACQPADTPSNQVPVDEGRYQRLVGRLLYLAHTRPDLAYALSIVSQFMHNPREQHMNVVIRILRYLKSAPGKGILFTKNIDCQSVDAYTDADRAGTAKFRGMELGICESLWLKVLLGDLSYSPMQPAQLYCDNKVTCDIAHNPILHDRTKYVQSGRRIPITITTNN
ncbi:hypothetical protein CsSME_00014803 [Camellia sinensis var. sinensis]